MYKDTTVIFIYYTHEILRFLIELIPENVFYYPQKSLSIKLLMFKRIKKRQSLAAI